MIFVVFGTIPIPFNSLANEIDEIAASHVEDFYVQSGYTSYHFSHAISVPFLSFSEMQNKIQEASLIITHGGYGTIYDALQKGKKVIAVPRAIGEHNHSQFELIRELEKNGHVLAVYSMNDLTAKIAAAKDHVPRRLVMGNAAELINRFIADAFNANND